MENNGGIVWIIKNVEFWLKNFKKSYIIIFELYLYDKNKFNTIKYFFLINIIKVTEKYPAPARYEPRIVRYIHRITVSK